MSTKLVIFNTLSFNTDNSIRFFSCKRLHFELGIVTTTTNGYHAPSSPFPPPYNTTLSDSK